MLTTTNKDSVVADGDKKVALDPGAHNKPISLSLEISIRGEENDSLVRVQR